MLRLEVTFQERFFGRLPPKADRGQVRSIIISPLEEIIRLIYAVGESGGEDFENTGGNEAVRISFDALPQGLQEQLEACLISINTHVQTNKLLS